MNSKNNISIICDTIKVISLLFLIIISFIFVNNVVTDNMLKIIGLTTMSLIVFISLSIFIHTTYVKYIMNVLSINSDSITIKYNSKSLTIDSSKSVYITIINTNANSISNYLKKDDEGNIIICELIGEFPFKNPELSYSKYTLKEIIKY